MVEPVEKKKPESPISAPAPPKASAKPQAHQAIVAMEKFATILAMPMPAFLPRENPISRNAKPACMNITSTVATMIHVTLSSSTTVVSCSSIGPPRSYDEYAAKSVASGGRGLWPDVENFSGSVSPWGGPGGEPNVRIFGHVDNP